MIIAYLKVLLRRNLLLLWLGQIVSQFGDRLTLMALIGLVYELEPHSPFLLAKMFSLAIIPVFLISPVAGVYVDRWNKQRTMYISDLIRGIFIFLIPVIFFKYHSLLAVYILIFLSFCVGRVFIPAKMAVIPSIVDKDKLFLANSLISITAMIAAVIGLGLGGCIVEKWGVRTAFLIDSTTFFISALAIISMSIKEKSNFVPKDIIELGKKAVLEVKKSIIFEMKEGIKYILKSPETLYVTKIKVVLFSIIGSLYTVVIVFIQNMFNSKTEDLGYIAIGLGAGLLLGTLIYGRFGLKTSANPVREPDSLTSRLQGGIELSSALTKGNYPDKSRVTFSNGAKKIINLSLLSSCLWLVIFVSLLKMIYFYGVSTFFCFFIALYPPEYVSPEYAFYIVLHFFIVKIYLYEIFTITSFFILGILCSPIEITLHTLIHHESQNGFLGRIFSSLEVVLHLAFIVFMFISAYLAERMSPFTIITSIGIIIVFFSLYNLIREK